MDEKSGQRDVESTNVLGEQLTKLIEQNAELRRQVQVKDQQINAYANPPAPSFTLSAEVVQATVSILTALPYSQVANVLTALQVETQVDG